MSLLLRFLGAPPVDDLIDIADTYIFEVPPQDDTGYFEASAAEEDVPIAALATEAEDTSLIFIVDADYLASASIASAFLSDDDPILVLDAEPDVDAVDPELSHFDLLPPDDPTIEDFIIVIEALDTSIFHEQDDSLYEATVIEAAPLPPPVPQPPSSGLVTRRWLNNRANRIEFRVRR